MLDFSHETEHPGRIEKNTTNKSIYWYRKIDKASEWETEWLEQLRI